QVARSRRGGACHRATDPPRRDRQRRPLPRQRRVVGRDRCRAGRRRRAHLALAHLGLPAVRNLTPMRSPYPPVILDGVLDDPGLVWRLARANGPYFPVQRYFANAAEMNALSGTRNGERTEMRIGPVFRGDWAYDAPLVDGLEP